jgi:alpha-amylase
MGVILQAFYWDCPKAENREHQWWVFIKSKLPSIAQAGFTAFWLPPANKAAGWKSMGYDPYDYYDLGDFDQKGGVPTWFGSKAELLDLIQSDRAHALQVYADLVFNHNSGGDARELIPILAEFRFWPLFVVMVRLRSRCGRSKTER